MYTRRLDGVGDSRIGMGIANRAKVVLLVVVVVVVVIDVVRYSLNFLEI